MSARDPLAGMMSSLREQGLAFAAEGQFASAADRFRQLVKLAPDDHGAWLRLADALLPLDRYREAHEAVLRASAIAPTRPADVLALVQRLRTFNEARAVPAAVARGSLRQWPIPALLQLAQALSSLNLQAEGLAAIEEARRGDPTFPPTLAARAQLLTYLGRLDEAEKDLRQCLARAPELAHAHWLLARLRTWTEQDNHVATLRRELARPQRKPDEVVRLAYALHKELDDLGRTEEAWEALDLACRTRRAAIRYSTSDSARLVEALLALPVQAPAPPAASAEGPVPVFIVGMHRSGTSLLEQILAGHDKIQDMGELYDFTAQMRQATDHYCRGVVDLAVVQRAPGVDLPAVGRAYLEAIDWRRRGRALAVDKLPSNFLNLGFILQALPQARVLHMVRDPRETCFSNLRELFSDANPYSYDQTELAEYFGLYARLMQHWAERFPGRILNVRYDRLVGDSESTVREIADYCGIDFQANMLRPGAGSRAVATASAVQVRGGLRQRAVAKWRPYAEHLAPLTGRLHALGLVQGPDAAPV